MPFSGASRVNRLVKVLIVKPSSLGDVVQALPVLRLLKQGLPASQVYWWLDANLAPLLEGDPDLSGIIAFERRRWRSPLRWPEAWRSLQLIRRQRFDWVIDLQGLLRSGLVTWLANAQLTIGVEDHREGAPAFYDVRLPRPSYETHAVDWYLAALRVVGLPVHWDFQWLPERPGVAAGLREKWPVDGSRWIVLHPGARWLNKRWPPGHFAELVRLFSASHSEVRFAILGAQTDSELGQTIAHAAPGRCLELAGKTSLAEMIEWIRLSELTITNDTGPMHVAAALRKPVVAIFGPTDPRRTGPYGQIERVIRSELPCIPCMKDVCRYEKPIECLRAISPQLIFARAQARLAESSGEAPRVE